MNESKKTKAPKKNVEKIAADHDFPTVGIGASAGGIKALKEFFAKMPVDSGMAFVVILHLSEEYESSLAQILQSNTAMPVMQITETVKVEPNHVYVIPPAKGLAMVDGTIQLTEPTHIKGKRVPIDLFFRTLADAYGKNGIAVVLSGTGSDGTLGLERVKEHGGIGIAQEPSEAEYDGMPRSAINTGLVDLILPVGEMPARIIGLRQNGGKIRLPKEKDKITPPPKGKEPDALQAILAIVRVRTGHDFSNYKHATVLRRIARRLQVHGLAELPEYLEFLRENEDEAQQLQRDLLISVTNFFRDQEAFEALEREVIPKLFAGKTSADTVRVWSVGCATGDEAYSLAMLLDEFASGITDAPKIQIFASDINEQAIATARDCFYDEPLIADVSLTRLRRYFVKEGDCWRVRKQLRETVLFAPHNILRDPPFSKLDLIVCRNLLIYFNRETQEKVLGIFNFALRGDGYLFLGASESAESSPALFSVTDKKYRIYKARPAAHFQPPPAMPSSGKWNVRIPQLPIQASEPQPPISYGEIHVQLVEQFAPPSVLVNEEYEIVHVSEHAGRFLHVAGGSPTRDLLKIIHPSLKLDLQSALFEAKTGKFVSESRNIRFNSDLGFGISDLGFEDKTNPQSTIEKSAIEKSQIDSLVNITVRLLQSPETAAGFYLVIFNESKAEAAPEETGQRAQTIAGRDAVDNIVSQLEKELQINRERLRATIEQNETSSEELKASNEEMQAMNEELRSASEELETGKEELQSLNEELMTVNAELKDKVGETIRVNSDLRNLIQSTDIGTIFLDRALRVKRYTPRVAELFNIIPSDIGRPLEHLTHQLDYDLLNEDAAEVLQTLHFKEREVCSGADDSRYLVRLAPYRTLDDKIDGVVLSFQDITDLKRANDDLQESEDRFSAIVNQTTAGMMQTDLTGKIILTNDRFCEITGYECDELLEMRIQDLTHEEDLPPSAKLFERTATLGEPFAVEKRLVRQDGSLVWIHNTVTAITGADGKPKSILAVTLDISERKQTEEALQSSEEKYRNLFNSIDEGFCTVEMLFDDAGKPRDYLFLEVNPMFEKLTGLTDVAGKTALELVPNIEEFWIENFGKVALTGETVRFENYSEAINRWLDVFATRIGDETSRKVAIIFTNVTTRRRAEMNLVFLAEISQDLAGLTGINEMMQVVEAKIGAYLNLSACAFVEINEAADEAVINHAWNWEDVPDVVAVYRISEYLTDDFQKASRAGEMFVVSDTATDSRTDAAQYAALKICSFITVPLIQDGEWRFMLVVYHSKPHNWQADEIKLIGELTTHIWTRLERARADAALQASEEKYRSLFNTIDQGYCIVEMIFDARGKPVDYRFLQVSPSFENQTGLINATGKRVSEIIPQLEDYWFETFGKVALTGEPARFENRAESLNRWYDVYAFRFGDPENHQVALLFNDITERKQMVEALKTADRRKDEFLAMLAHELRNPLAPIRSGVEIIRRADCDEAMIEQTLEIVERQTNQIVHLVDDLLDISRITQGKIKLRKGRIELQTAVEMAVETTRDLIMRNGQDLTVSLPDAPVFIDADLTRIAQIIVNLLNNSAKYTEPGGKIWLTAETKADEVEIRIRDTGIGIPPEMLSGIFEIFTQIETTDEQARAGLGIGLSVVKSLTEMHDGSIEAFSAGKGKGSEFVVRLPLLKDEGESMRDEGEGIKDEINLSDSSLILHSASLKILVVDDNADALEMMKVLLTLDNHTVRTAFDGETAIKIAPEFQPEVCILDIGLPGMNGYELARRLRMQMPQVFLIALSGWGQDEDRRRSNEAGFNHHLVKPIEIGKLQSLLAEIR